MRHAYAGQPTRRIVMLRVTMALSGLVLAGCASAHAGTRPSVPVPGELVPASAIHRLTAIADQAVKVNGGHAVVWATAVVTTRAKALTSATPGDLIPNDTKTVVYLVTMKGHFTAAQF